MPQIRIPRHSGNWDPQEFHTFGSPGIPQIWIPRNSTNWDPQEFHKLGSPGIPKIGRIFERFQKFQDCSQLVNIFKNPSGIFQNMQNPQSLFRIFSKNCKGFSESRQNSVKHLSDFQEFPTSKSFKGFLELSKTIGNFERFLVESLKPVRF
jgi:hypothetical protein